MHLMLDESPLYANEIKEALGNMKDGKCEGKLKQDKEKVE